MKFSFVTLFVKDIEQSLAFYHGLLGLTVLSEGETQPGGKMVFLGEQGQPSIELISSPENNGMVYSGFSVGFEVENMQSTMAMLKEHGYPLTKGPITPQSGTTLAFFEGPNGEEVELVEHVK